MTEHELQIPYDDGTIEAVPIAAYWPPEGEHSGKPVEQVLVELRDK